MAGRTQFLYNPRSYRACIALAPHQTQTKPKRKENMSTPQSAIIPETAQAGFFIEADILSPDAVQAACLAALSALEARQRQFAGEDLGLTLAFGSDFWRSLKRADEAAELKNFTPLGKGLAPATQHDLLIHIQSKNHDACFTLARDVLATFDGAIAVKSETHGFRRHQNRGLDGFVDGTENPHEDPEIRRIGTVPEGEAGAGGSYIVVQKYLHDLKKWESYNLAEQEETIARTKEDDIEFSKEQRLPRSHIGRVNLKENGVGLKIVRRSLPFGNASGGEHGLMFIAYAARLHNIEAQLLSMFGDADGQTDLVLERMSLPVSGGYYYAPSVERLRALKA